MHSSMRTSQPRTLTPIVLPGDRFGDDDAALLRALKAGDIYAASRFYERYANHIARVLTRILGPDRELADLINDTFCAAYASVHRLKDSAKMKAWITKIAVHVARSCIRKRQRRRVLWFRYESDYSEPLHVPEPADPDVNDALSAVQAVLTKMSLENRIVFSLRFIEQLDLSAVAEACGVSLATVKRRIQRAEGEFAALARKHDCLVERMARTEKWESR